jgi:hypothetical protein
MKDSRIKNYLKFTIYLPFLVLSMIISGCGGSGGGSGTKEATAETVSGQFVDAPVSGLTYSCSTASSGVTNNNGEYSCNVGDTVTFSINGFVIGSASAAAVVTPYDISGDDTQAINIAQLLQTLDSDGDPTNGISIAQSGVMYDLMGTLKEGGITLAQVDFDTNIQAYIDAAYSAAGLTAVTLVDADTAETELIKSIAGLSGYVSSEVNAAITQQLVPTSITDPIYVELVTVADYPVLLKNPMVSVPAGFKSVTVSENVDGRDCPNGSSGCKQRWDLKFTDDGACEVDGNYDFSFTVGCAAGGDCDTIDPKFTDFAVTATLDSENYCAGTEVGYDPFTATAAVTQQIVPTDVKNPLYVELVTISDAPYRLAANNVTIPSGLTLQSFSEDEANADCPNSSGNCKQRWDLYLLDNSACALDGDYVFNFDTTCDVDGNCDPAATYQVQATLDSENYCAGFDSFKAVAAITQQIVPVDVSNPIYVELVTIADAPYRLTANNVTIPSGFNLQSFSEDTANAKCPNSSGNCKQRWDLYLIDNGACALDGDYVYSFDTTCDEGGNCDPAANYQVKTRLNSGNYCD